MSPTHLRLKSRGSQLHTNEAQKTRPKIKKKSNALMHIQTHIARHRHIEVCLHVALPPD